MTSPDVHAADATGKAGQHQHTWRNWDAYLSSRSNGPKQPTADELKNIK
jgi:hypothetical protein